MAKRLTLEKRIRLETLLKLPFSGFMDNLSMAKKLPKIAKLLEISQSTIYREVIERGFDYASYDANKAQLQSLDKVSNGNKRYRYSEEQKQLILEMYKEFATNKSWSPNALMLRLKTELAPNIKLPSVEIIYQWIYEDAGNGGVLYKLLPRSHRKRKRKAVQRKEIISNKQSIHSRDEIVEERSRIGDIEIDSVVGPFNHAGIITGTERRSRYNMARLVKNKTGNETLAKLLEMLLVHKKKIKTITSDNGVEFALHLAIASELNAQYYFADPYSSYQRGSNEHGNGMIRRYFPKGTNFSLVTEGELQLALYKINHLPRKIHNGKTAHEIFYGINKKLIPAKQRKILICAFRT
jgi:IS30 family transposase